MKKCIAAFLAALLLLLALGACGQETEDPPTEPPTATAETTQESVTTSTETSTADAKTSAGRYYGMIYDPDDPPGPSDIWLALQLQSKDKASFLRIFGFTDKTAPFYRYYNNDSALQLELYYDMDKEEGVGIFYGTGVYEWEGMTGFRVGAAEKAVWKDHKFLITTEYHDDISHFATLPEYKERKTYNNQGKLSGFHATATYQAGEDLDEPYTRDLIKITWHYREDGTLWKKDSYIGPGTTRGSEKFFYDKQERVKYTTAYITHGYLEDYYIYENGSKTPSYRLTLDHMGGLACEDEFVKY